MITKFISFGLHDFKIIFLHVIPIIIELFLLLKLAFGLGVALHFEFSLVTITFVGLLLRSFVFIITYSHIFGFCFFVLPVIGAIYFFNLAIFGELHSSLLPVLTFVPLNCLLNPAIEIFAAHQLVNLKQIKLLIERFFFSNPISISVFFPLFLSEWLIILTFF